jgi:hypothetical protein
VTDSAAMKLRVLAKRSELKTADRTPEQLVVTSFLAVYLLKSFSVQLVSTVPHIDRY